MKGKLRSHKHIFTAAIVLIAFVFVCFSIQTSAHEKEKKKIRIGWYEVNNFQEGMARNAIKSGYSYEYLQKLSDYTGWEYEYVYGNWSTLLTQLENCKIDLLAGVAWTEERSDKMLFPNNIMGTDSFCIYQHEASKEMKLSDISSFAGKKIGSIKKTKMNECLIEWKNKNNAEFEIVYFDSIKEMEDAFDNNELDGIVGVDDIMDTTKDYSFITQIGEENYYLAANKERSDLIKDYDDAVAILQEMEPSFVSNLENSSYGITLSNRKLTEEEEDWIAFHNILRIGYMDNYLPYCSTDSEGNAYGLLTDVVSAILSDLKITGSVDAVYYSYENYQDMIDALKRGDIDAAFPVGGGIWNMERDGINSTTEVISASMDLVFKGNYTADKANIIAVNRNNRLQYYYTCSYFPDAKIELFDNINDCINAVNTGAADSTIVNGYRTNLIRNNSEYSSLSTVQLPDNDDRSFGVRSDEMGLLFLLNRGINLIGPEYAVNAGYNYINDFYKTSWTDFLKENAFAVLFIAALFFGTLIFLLLLYIRGVRKTKAEKEKQLSEITALNDELEKQMRVIQFMGKVYFASFIVDLQTNTFEEMNNISVVRQQIGIKGNAQEALYLFADKMVRDESTERLREFINLSTVEERLSNKSFVTCDYIGNTSGWSQLYIIAGDRDEDGKLRHVFVTSRLIHAEKQREEEQNKNLADALEAAQNANRAKTTFLSNISHDIRTPMNAIIGFTNLAESHIDDKATVQEYLKKIGISSQHLLSLINGVLDMSRIESGKMKMDENDVNLAALMEEIQTIVMPSITAKKIDFRLDYDKVIHRNFIADKLRLNQVIINILSNAIKFTPAQGNICVTIDEKEYEQGKNVSLEFRFKDSGIGMSEEFREHIFEAFTRERTSTVSGIQGTGLGMAITKNIVDMMGGNITVNSKVGEGSEFVIDLQFKVREEEASVPVHRQEKDGSDGSEYSARGKHLLLVEDNEINQEIARTILEEAGYTVTVACDGTEAVTLMEESKRGTFCLVLMDIQMPKMDGYEATRRIRGMRDWEKASIPIYAMTANAFAEDREKAFAAGMNGHLSKPINVKELLQTIEEALSRK